MRCLIAGFALALAWEALLSPAHADGPKAHVDPSFVPLHQWDPGIPGASPPVQSYQPPRPRPPVQSYQPPRPRRFCDAYGRCWERVPSYAGPSYAPAQRRSAREERAHDEGFSRV